MKPAWIILAIAGSVGGWMLTNGAELEGSWVSTEGREGERNGFVLEAKDGSLTGRGSWHAPINGAVKDCAVAIDVSFVSKDERRLIGLATAGADCLNERTQLDCTLSKDGAELDCGPALKFRRDE